MAYTYYSKSNQKITEDLKMVYDNTPKNKSVFSGHRVGDAEVMICQLDSDHLMNTIQLYFDKLAECSPTQVVTYDPLTALMADKVNTTVDKERFLFLLNILQPYLLEMLLRQSTDTLPEELKKVVTNLHQLFGRNSSVASPLFYREHTRKYKQLKSAECADKEALLDANFDEI